MKPALVPEPRTSAGRIPPLEPGDHLTRAEFERRYEAMPGVMAELIAGVVHLPSPVRYDYHGGNHVLLTLWYGRYFLATPGLKAADNTSVRLLDESVVQPAAVLFVSKELGGGVALGVDGILEGPPEWVAEVAASSVSLDLHEKFDLYRSAGVREYLVWRVQDQAIDWFVLDGGRYRPLPADERGITRSTVFPGLWLDAAALAHENMDRVLRVLEEGIRSPEHAAFAANLSERKANSPSPREPRS